MWAMTELPKEHHEHQVSWTGGKVQQNMLPVSRSDLQKDGLRTGDNQIYASKSLLSEHI